MAKNVFVFGLNDANRDQMAHIPNADEYEFHSLLAPEEIVEAEAFEFGPLLEKARRQLDGFRGSVDAIVTFWDFPSTELLAMLCEERGLPGPSVESLVRCAHKHRSRTEQRKVIDENIPAFQPVNPFDRDPLSKITLKYPFFLKPVKSYASYLSYYIDGPEDFDSALRVIRKNIARYGRPYNTFLEAAGVDHGGVDAQWCIAEEAIGGKMCTMEGFSRNGEVTTFGLIDSHRFPGRTTFSRYQYPSTLPVSVRERIDTITRKVISHIGYENGAFNIEFFYDRRLDQVWLLEINPRISQSHSNLFFKVDGAPNHKIIVDLALGRQPQLPKREGQYKVAAKFYLREFGDGVVSKVPSATTIQEIEEEFPGAIVLPHVTVGQRLSELHDQEPYSYRLGVVYMGGQSQHELLEKFRRCKEELGFRVRSVPTEPGRAARRRNVGTEGKARVVSRFPYQVEGVEHVWVAMRDGCRLSARVWRPSGAEQSPVPAVLEYTPERKRDRTRKRDEMTHAYLAGHGYACVRVDMRGCGDSEGVLEDECLDLEERDGLDVLSWIADQPWCNGKVGMIGVGWGGTNALRLAARRPPQLEAVIAVCPTYDRYSGGMHYMGGCLLADSLTWSTTMLAHAGQPPDPEIVGEEWMDRWLERLEASNPWIEKWMRHPCRDGYWKQGSVSESYDEIDCPVLVVGGWEAGGPDAVFRLMKELTAPCKGIVGPWGRAYPHLEASDRAIDFLGEALRWWDRWLRSEENDAMSGPDLTVWMEEQGRLASRTDGAAPSGRWLALPGLSETIRRRGFWLTDENGLVTCNTPPPPGRAFKVQSPLTAGLFGGKWWTHRTPPIPSRQLFDHDGGAVVFEGKPLRHRLALLGAPEVELEIASERPAAMLAVRLSHVSPDDKVARLAHGLLNLTHRDGHDSPHPLKRGKRYTVRVRLDEIAQTVPKGHRLRVGIASCCWPAAWPPPEPTRLSVYTGASRLIVPTIPRDAERPASRRFRDPVASPSGRVRRIARPRRSWVINRDMMQESTTEEVVDGEGTLRYEDLGLEMSSVTSQRYSYRHDDYYSVSGETSCDLSFEREGWNVGIRARSVLTSSKRRFRVRAMLDAFLDGSRVYSRSWDELIPRKLV
jgi:hypothetical protein